MDFFKAIEDRHSYRGEFEEGTIPEADLVKIVDAGMRAPSGCNEQTTSFVIVTNPSLRAEIAKLINSDAVRTAPAVIVACTRRVTFNFGLDFELEDYGAAVSNILLAATALGYASVWLDGQSRLSGMHLDLARLLDIPAGQIARTILPVGVPVKPGRQPARKPFDERVTWKK